jgi:hypothetical protein
MRIVNHHLAKGEKDALTIMVMDTPRPGEAHHRYEITGFDTAKNPAAVGPDGYRTCYNMLPVIFDNPAAATDGQKNGVTMQQLLDICTDRLRHEGSDAETLSALESLARVDDSLRNLAIRKAREKAYFAVAAVA